MITTAPAPDLTRHFLHCVDQAIATARQCHADAQLIKVTVLAAKTTPLNLRSMRVMFRVGDDTLILLRTQWGEFATQLLRGPWVSGEALAWPVPMDVAEASGLVQQAGYQAAYEAITLRQLLSLGSHSACYMFATNPGATIFVDVNSKQVTTC